MYIGCNCSSYKTQDFSWFYLLSSGLSLRKRVRWGNIRNCLGALTQTSTRLHLTPWKRKKGMNRNRYRKLHRSIYLIIHSKCVKTFLVPRKEKLYALNFTNVFHLKSITEPLHLCPTHPSSDVGGTEVFVLIIDKH